MCQVPQQPHEERRHRIPQVSSSVLIPSPPGHLAAQTPGLSSDSVAIYAGNIITVEAVIAIDGAVEADTSTCSNTKNCNSCSTVVVETVCSQCRNCSNSNSNDSTVV